MNLLKIPFLLIWRLWFYILIICTILLMAPFLFVLTIKESYYPAFWKLIRGWAHVLVYGMGFRIDKQIDEALDREKSYMFCPNHASLMDPFVLIVLSKNPIVFVGKKELSKIPLFGFIYKRTCILVDRNNSQSRRAVFNSAQQKINLGYSICIFPEGGVPSDESIILDDFKDGAFRLAIEHKIPIAPVTFHDNKKLFSYTFFSGGPGKMRVMLHPLISTSNYSIEMKKELNKKTRAIILEELENPSF